MRIRVKLTALVFLCMAAFVVVAVFYAQSEDRKLRNLLDDEEAGQRLSFYRILRFSGASLGNFVFDYSRRDDMAGFVKSGDRAWAQANIARSLRTSTAEAAWVYAPDGRQVYSVTAADDRDPAELRLGAEDIPGIFGKSRSCRFFVDTPGGLMEVRGSAIYPDIDAARSAGPRGYFLAGRVWGRKYISELSYLLDADVSIIAARGKNSLPNISNPATGIFGFSKALKSWDGDTLAFISVRKESGGIGRFREASYQTLLIMVSCLVVFCVVLWYSLSHWVAAPLRVLSDAFIRKEPVTDKGLLTTRDEFSSMVTMTNKFFEQRKRLLAEMAEHSMALRALRLSEEKFSKAFRANPSIVAIFSRDDGRFLEVNDTFLKATGYTRDEVIGRGIGETAIMSAESAEVIRSIMEKQAGIHDMEVAYTTKSGEARACLFSAEKIDVGAKQTVLLVGSDITERRQAEKNLEEAQKQLVQSEKMAALGRFASGVAHEVKNPLAIVLGGLEYLKLKLAANADPEVREAMEKMRESVLRADVIVKDLLAFARPSRTVFEKTDPAVLLRDAISFIDIFLHKSDTANVKIRQELIDHEMCVEVDRNQMQQALFNIMMNAIEAIGANGEVVLKAYPSEEAMPHCGDRVCAACVLEVRDTGCGVSASDLSKVFEPFFTTKRERKGTGLGLAITRSIVEKHKGIITIESAQGKGTTVRILLPLAPKDAKDAKEAI